VILRLGNGQAYAWSEPWNAWLDARRVERGHEWIHSGIAVSRTGDLIVTGHHSAEAFILAPDGSVRSSFQTGLTQSHGLRLVVEDGREVLWIADNGVRYERGAGGGYEEIAGTSPPRVVKMTLRGQHLLSITAPDIESYRTGTFSPTLVAVNEEAYGGNGDVWIADGYGCHLVHRFDKFGSYLSSLSGSEGAGHYNVPHAVWIDRRRADPELYVSDSLNRRIQVYDLEGTYQRVVGGESTFRPITGFAADGSNLIVSERQARVTVLDGDDKVVGHLGDDPTASARAGFPNRLDRRGRPAPPVRRPGSFISPHAVDTDADGNLYFNECLIGGRLVKLTKL